VRFVRCSGRAAAGEGEGHGGYHTKTGGDMATGDGSDCHRDEGAVGRRERLHAPVPSDWGGAPANGFGVVHGGGASRFWKKPPAVKYVAPEAVDFVCSRRGDGGRCPDDEPSGDVLLRFASRVRSWDRDALAGDRVPIVEAAREDRSV
jgi:hypothetical protein